MKAVFAAIMLIRPINGFVAALSMLPAGTIACGHFVILWRESALIFSLVSFGYVVNDIFDVRADLINRPNRALPSGQVSVATAWGIAAACLLAASAAMIGASTTEWIYYVAVAILLYAYAWRISSWLIVGNMLVALLCASVFLLAGLACGGVTTVKNVLITGALLTFLYHLGREIIKDIEDVAGDGAIARSTIPLKWGAGVARATATVVFGILILSAYLAAMWLDLPARFVILLTLLVNLPLVLIFVLYALSDASQRARRVSIALKVLMIPALAVLMFVNVN